MGDKTVLVTGATGTVSTALLGALKRKPGVRLRALVRDPTGAKAQALQKEGVEVVAGDLEEPDTLTEAFEGVDILWLLTPASALEPSMGSNAVTAARKAKIGHIVRNSAIKAGHDAPNRNGRLHALVEESVKASGIPWTILRPHYYMQNLLSSANSVASDGVLYMKHGTGPRRHDRRSRRRRVRGEGYRGRGGAHRNDLQPNRSRGSDHGRVGQDA